jgi:hypothetical protein
MAQVPDVVFDQSLVQLKRALGITTCAMVAAKDSEWFDHRPEIEYALWQVQENLCDVILDLEEEVEHIQRFGSADRMNAIEEAARLVERFNDAPVVIPPTESFATVIARAIRLLATNKES